MGAPHAHRADDEEGRISRPALGRPAAARRHRAGTRRCSPGCSCSDEITSALDPELVSGGAQHRAAPERRGDDDGAGDHEMGFAVKSWPRRSASSRDGVRRGRRPARADLQPPRDTPPAGFLRRIIEAGRRLIPSPASASFGQLGSLRSAIGSYPAAHCAATHLRTGSLAGLRKLRPQLGSLRSAIGSACTRRRTAAPHSSVQVGAHPPFPGNGCIDAGPTPRRQPIS